MKISDLAGFSKPATKLIEVVSQGIGAVFEPTLIRRRAEAEAHRVRVMTGAMEAMAQNEQMAVSYASDGLEIRLLPSGGALVTSETELAQRAAVRGDFKALKEQQNLENVLSAAAAQLELPGATVNDEEVDEDWISRFFSSAQNVTSTEMQALWGRILAGEIAVPGSYSLRSLDVVRNLTKGDAELFERFTRISFQHGKLPEVVVHSDKDWLASNDIALADILELVDVGLINGDQKLALEFQLPVEGQPLVFVRGGSGVEVVFEPGSVAARLPILRFSSVGAELSSLTADHNEQNGELFLNVALALGTGVNSAWLVSIADWSEGELVFARGEALDL